MSEWKTEILGELFLVKNDKTKQLNSDAYQAVGKYPIVDQSISPICGYSDDTSKVYNTNLPVTIFGDHTRHVKYVDYPFIAGADGTQILKPIYLEDKFFYYTVLYASERIGNYGYDRHLKHLKEYETAYPVKESAQRRIAHILTTCDAVIEKTQAAIGKYKSIKQGMLHDLFTRGIDITTGKLRPKYEDAPEFYKESKLGMVPRNWEVDEIGNIVHIKHGYSFDGKYFSNEKSEYILLTPGNFNVDGSLYFQDRNTKYFVGEIPNDFVFNNGDLLIVMTDLTQDMNILGNVVKMNSPYKVLHNQRIGKIELLKHELDKDYLLFILNTPFSKDNIKKTATGTTVRHTAPNHIYKGIIPIPNIAEQNKIAERIMAIDKKIQTEQIYLHKLQSIKQGLMGDLLSGKKRVPVPEETITHTEN